MLAGMALCNRAPIYANFHASADDEIYVIIGSTLLNELFAGFEVMRCAFLNDELCNIFSPDNDALPQDGV